MSDGWQVEAKPVPPELEDTYMSPAFAHGVQVIDRLDDTTRAKLGQYLRDRLDEA